MNRNVIPLFSKRRPVAEPAASQPAFTLRARGSTWSIKPEGEVSGRISGKTEMLNPDQMLQIADLLRNIARGLQKIAYREAGQVPDDCIGEFAIHQGGGIDYWLSPALSSADDRARLKIALRNAIASIKD